MNFNEIGSVEILLVDVLFKNNSGFKNGDYIVYVIVICLVVLWNYKLNCVF